MDRYLDYYDRSDDAMLHVLAVLDEFDRQIQFTIVTALDGLKTPQNIGATILQFRPRQTFPDKPQLDPAS